MKYAAIADWAADKLYPVTFMCAQLGLARQGYYRWLTQGPCQRERSDGELTEQIRDDLHTSSTGTRACAGSGPNWWSKASVSPASGSGG